MTVEPQSPHDQDDDDFYVLGEDDAEGAAKQPQADPNAAYKAAQGSGTRGAEEDVLFVPTEEQKLAASKPTKGPQWEEEHAEPSTGRGSGAGRNAAPTGQLPPAEAEASDEDLNQFAQTGDFAIIDASAQLAEMDNAPDAPVNEETQGPEDAPLEGEGAFEPVEAEAGAEAGAEGEEQTPEEDDAWAPIEASEDPLLDGPTGVTSAAEAAQMTPEDVGMAADADAAVVAAAAAAVHGPTLVAGPGASGRRRLGRAVAAAVVLVCFGGGFYAWQQGWLGTHEAHPTMVERAEIPRPRVTVMPEPPKPEGGDPTPESRPDPKPESQPDIKSDPVDPKPIPIAKDPVEPPPDTMPKGGEPPSPGGAQGNPQLPDLSRELVALHVGDGLTIKENPETEQPKERVSMNGIVPGSQAFAQLRNGNFFVGNVKAVETDIVTLKLEKGEVSIAIPDLKTIVSLASSEYKELKKVEKGYIRLNNRNRLLGTILASQDENIILENKANRVVIPKSEIEELGTVQQSTVRFVDEDTSWVDRMLERQLSEQEAKEKEKVKISPAPLVEQKGKSAEKPKIKSRVEDDSGASPK